MSAQISTGNLAPSNGLEPAKAESQVAGALETKRGIAAWLRERNLSIAAKIISKYSTTVSIAIYPTYIHVFADFGTYEDYINFVSDIIRGYKFQKEFVNEFDLQLIASTAQSVAFSIRRVEA